MGARVYFPTLGRFGSVDPIDGGTPNRYVYVVDPINGGDYSGLGVTIVATFSFSGPNQSSTGNPQAGATAVKLQSSYASAPLTIVGVANYGGPAPAPATVKSPSAGERMRRVFNGVGNGAGNAIQHILDIPRASVTIATSTTAGCFSGALQGIVAGMAIEMGTHEEEVSEYTGLSGCVLGGAAAGLNAWKKGSGRSVESLDQALFFWQIYMTLITGGGI